MSDPNAPAGPVDYIEKEDVLDLSGRDGEPGRALRLDACVLSDGGIDLAVPHQHRRRDPDPGSRSEGEVS